MEHVVHILELTPSTLTRPRGEEAGRQVAAYVKAGAVEFDLDDTSPSLSFLDGFVLTLREERALHLVTFITKDSVVHERLARISAERDVTVYARPGVAHTKAPIAPTQSLEVDEHPEQTRRHSKFAQI